MYLELCTIYTVQLLLPIKPFATCHSPSLSCIWRRHLRIWLVKILTSILQSDLYYVCKVNATSDFTRWVALNVSRKPKPFIGVEHIGHLVIDCNLFSKLIFQIIDGSKANIYLTVKIWNYYSFIITCKFPFYYCKLSTIYVYHLFKPLVNYLRVTNFYFD